MKNKSPRTFNNIMSLIFKFGMKNFRDLKKKFAENRHKRTFREQMCLLHRKHNQ
jgi:hypothetical protein